MNQTTSSIFVGIDVSKARLDVAIGETGATWAVRNDVDGIAQLVKQFQEMDPELVVIEFDRRA